MACLSCGSAWEENVDLPKVGYQGKLLGCIHQITYLEGYWSARTVITFQDKEPKNGPIAGVREILCSIQVKW